MSRAPQTSARRQDEARPAGNSVNGGRRAVTNGWCWLRHPSAMHDGLRLIDMIWPLVLAPPFLLFRGSGWGLLWFHVGVVAVVLSNRRIPSCRAHSGARKRPPREVPNLHDNGRSGDPR